MRAGLCTTHIHRLFTTYLTKQRYEYFSFITKKILFTRLHPTTGVLVWLGYIYTGVVALAGPFSLSVNNTSTGSVTE